MTPLLLIALFFGDSALALVVDYAATPTQAHYSPVATLRFRASHPVRDVVGPVGDLSGDLLIDVDQPYAPLKLDLTGQIISLNSGERVVNQVIYQTFDGDKFPSYEFHATVADYSDAVKPPRLKFDVLGNLTLRGVTSSQKISLDCSNDPGFVNCQLGAILKISAFEAPPIRLLGLSASDIVTFVGEIIFKKVIQ